MATDLTLRILQINEDDGGFSSDRHISIRVFISACYDVLFGYHTAAQVKSVLQMTPNEQATLDVLIGKITSATTIQNRIARIMRIDAILTKWENDKLHTIATYTTPDEIEAHLLAIDTAGDV